MKTSKMARSRVFECGSSSHSVMFVKIAVAVLIIGLPSAHSQIEKIYVDVTEVNLLVDETRLFKLVQIGEYNETIDVVIQAQHPDIVEFSPPNVIIPGVPSANTTVEISYDISAHGKSPGHSDVSFNVTPSGIVNMDSVFILVTVMHSNAIYIISYIVGWVYFAAWSVSFYPQIYTNFRRKSVVGLNFDFLALNIMGFTMYSLFNCGLYFSSVLQAEYFARHPKSLNPVQLNDVFFSLHAVFATLITIIQCFIYERDDQRVSLAGRGLLAVFGLVVLVTAILGGVGTLEWLDFLYYCSYIKLAITLIKYVPQAYMNYKRKSTVGWSIGNIFLDFTGGFLSIFQMVLNAYNYNDWISFFGDVTKFGLGLFSLIFDVFFILQHYVFYRESNDFDVVVSNSSVESSQGETRSGEREYFLLVDNWEARYILLPGTTTEEHDNAESHSEGHYSQAESYQGAPADDG